MKQKHRSMLYIFVLMNLVILIGCGSNSSKTKIDTTTENQNKADTEQTSKAEKLSTETTKDNSAEAQLDVIAKKDYFINDSKLSLAFMQDNDKKFIWYFSYNTRDEIEAINAYFWMLTLSNSILEADKNTKTCHITLNLGDDRIIAGSPGPLMATNSDGTIATMSYPDWYDVTKISAENGISDFIRDSYIDFMSQ